MAPTTPLHDGGSGAGPGPVETAFPRPFPWRRARWALLPIGIALAMIPFARTTFYYVLPMLKGFPSGDIWDVSNHFGSGTGITLLVVAVWMLRHDVRRAVGVLLIAILLAGAVVETIKYTTWRLRPRYGVRLFHEYDRMREFDEFIGKHPGTRLHPTGDDQWLWWRGPRPWGDDFRSFPSGHAAAGFVFAAWLAALFPAARAFWWTMAVFCALARVEMQRHYIEDALVGSAIGWLAAHAAFSWAWVARLSVWLGGVVERALAAIARCVGRRPPPRAVA